MMLSMNCLTEYGVQGRVHLQGLLVLLLLLLLLLLGH
jgi:hypothetical protein